MIRFLSIVLCVWAFVACGQQTWTGTIYPDRVNLTRSETIGTFDSLESCRRACQSRLADRGATFSGDYECGLDCKPNPDLGGILVCSRTER